MGYYVSNNGKVNLTGIGRVLPATAPHMCDRCPTHCGHSIPSGRGLRTARE